MATIEIWNATRPLDVTPNNILCKLIEQTFARGTSFADPASFIIIIVVAMKDGRVHSFALEHAEEQPPIGFKSFVTQRWDMLIGKE